MAQGSGRVGRAGDGPGTLPALFPDALIAFNSKIDRATFRGEKLSLLGLNAFPSDIA